MPSLIPLLNDIQACTLCADKLPHGPRPVLQVGADSGGKSKAKILIAGQAPGRRVHATGVPFNDPSGERLRQWLGIGPEVFYDANKVAIVPMGFCYPGTGKSGDFPPPPECASTWHHSLLAELDAIEMTVILGQYALDYHLHKQYSSVTAAVSDWQRHWASPSHKPSHKLVPLPHPSPRNNRWLKNNPWFEQDLVPILQNQVAQLLQAYSKERSA